MDPHAVCLRKSLLFNGTSLTAFKQRDHRGAFVFS